MIATTRTNKAAAFLLALICGVLLVQGVSARDVLTTPSSAQDLADAHVRGCQRYGGTPSVHYEMNADGSVYSITVTCKGMKGLEDNSCTYKQGYTQTIVICELLPGATGPSEHAPIGGGALATPEAETSRSAVVGAFSTTAQAEDEGDEER